MTPYAAAKIVNATLKENGIEKAVPPQMLYTYTNKGFIKSVIVDGKKRVTDEGLQEWLTKYVNKLKGVEVTEATTETDVDENQLELDLEVDENVEA